MQKMTLDEAIIEVREHGILLTLNPIKGRQAIRIIFDAIRDYQRIRVETGKDVAEMIYGGDNDDER